METKPKILMLGPKPPPYGGVVSVMNEIMCSSLADSFEFEVFPTSGRDVRHKGNALQVALARIKKFAGYFRKVASGDYCFAHIHTSATLRGTVIYILLTRIAGVQAVLQIHHGNWDHVIVRGSRVSKFILREVVNLVSRILVMNASWLASLSNLGVRTPVTLVENFVGDDKPAEEAAIERARAELGLTERNFVITTVGAVVEAKGAYDTLDAAPTLVKADDNIRFLFVGGGLKDGDETRFRNEIEKRELSKWALATGEIDRENVYAYLGLTDLFLLPSHAESMPVSILEAMRSGLAIVTTPVGSIPTMITHDRNGLLISPSSPEAIAEAVLRLKSDKRERMEMAACARAAFDERYVSGSSIKRLREIYERHCGS